MVFVFEDAQSLQACKLEFQLVYACVCVCVCVCVHVCVSSTVRIP